MTTQTKKEAERFIASHLCPLLETWSINSSLSPSTPCRSFTNIFIVCSFVSSRPTWHWAPRWVPSIACQGYSFHPATEDMLLRVRYRNSPSIIRKIKCFFFFWILKIFLKASIDWVTYNLFVTVLKARILDQDASMMGFWWASSSRLHTSVFSLYPHSRGKKGGYSLGSLLLGH